MSHESWITTSSASTIELTTNPPTGLLLRDSARGEKSRSWAKRLSTFSKRPARQGISVPAAVDLRVIRDHTTKIYAPFSEPDESLQSHALQEQPMPVLPEAEEDDYWRAGLKEWIATRAPVNEQPARPPAPVTPPIPHPSARTPPPIGLGITLPRGVHFATPIYPKYREAPTAHPKLQVYKERITSSANSSIHEPYTKTSQHAPSQHHASIPNPMPRKNQPNSRVWTQAPSPTHQPHHQANHPSTTSSTNFNKPLPNPTPPLHPTTSANTIPTPIPAPRTLTSHEKAHIRGFASPGTSAATATAAAPQSTVQVTARGRAWQTRLHRRHRRRVRIISLFVVALICMLSGVIAALVVSGEGDGEMGEGKVGYGM